MERIKQKYLERQVLVINELTNSPLVPWDITQKPMKACVGNYHLDYAYGGVKLVRIVNEDGGIQEISTSGFGTKRELNTWMSAFITGLTN